MFASVGKGDKTYVLSVGCYPLFIRPVESKVKSIIQLMLATKCFGRFMPYAYNSADQTT